MTEKTKKIILISIGCLLCVAVAVGIATRFGGSAEVPSGVVSDDPTQSGDPNVDIDNNGQTDLDIQVETPDASETDSAQGADSSGLEQTIQADPVKPEQPEKPEAPAGTSTLPEDHDAEDVPEEERKTEDEEPPTYEEQPTVSPMYPASAMWKTAVRTLAFRTMRCTKTAIRSAKWAAGIERLYTVRRSQ